MDGGKLLLRYIDGFRAIAGGMGNCRKLLDREAHIFPGISRHYMQRVSGKTGKQPGDEKDHA